MEMVIKYKAGELAKDLDLKSKDLLDLLEKKYGEKKKVTSALTEQELNYVFDFYSKAAEVKGFDELLQIAERKAQEAAKAKEADKAKEVQAVKETPKPAEAQRPAAQPAHVVQNAQIVQPAQNAQGTAQPAQNAQGTVQRPPHQGFRPNTNVAPTTFRPNTNTAPGGLRPNTNTRPPQQSQPPAPKAPPVRRREIAKPVMSQEVGTLITTGYQPKAKGPTQEKREIVAVKLDTRTVDVNLDKFNERYDTLSAAKFTPSHGGDFHAGKQKFKSKMNARPQPFQRKKETETERLQRIQLEKARKAQLKVMIPDEITVGELAIRLKAAAADVIKRLMKLGVMAGVSEVIDFDTAALVSEELGAKVEKEVIVTIEERLFNESFDDASTELTTRPPVVVVMGHVDHGKTSLLDAVRKTSVTTGEAGGITQHIGAYQVEISGSIITFLDTPGHEAFTSMRARGASVTDIAILVVAADDGIMPQTIEAINHAKAAGVAIIVAINKIDKPAANIEKVKQELTEYGLVAEEWGGDTIMVPVSALTGEGLDTLLEMVTLVSEMKDLKADATKRAHGTVIEARLDKGLGPVATVLVQRGTLNKGDVIIAGTTVGRVRVMTDDKGKKLETAGPSTPVEITGLTDVPAAGDIFDAVADERLARELAQQRFDANRQQQFSTYQKVTLDNLFSQIAQGELKELAIIVKADVQGSAEAVKQSLEKIENAEVRVRVIHTGVGAINKSDVMLANASGAIIIGFNVRPDLIAQSEAEQAQVEMRMYRIIYDAIDDVKAALKGMLAPKYREVELGRIEVRQVYKISTSGTIAGCYVQSGKVTRAAKIRVVRDGIVVAEDEIDSLRRFKDDVKEAAQGYECGIGLAKFADIKEGDIFEAFIIEEYRD